MVEGRAVKLDIPNKGEKPLLFMCQSFLKIGVFLQSFPLHFFIPLFFEAFTL